MWNFRISGFLLARVREITSLNLECTPKGKQHSKAGCRFRSQGGGTQHQRLASNWWSYLEGCGSAAMPLLPSIHPYVMDRYTKKTAEKKIQPAEMWNRATLSEKP